MSEPNKEKRDLIKIGTLGVLTAGFIGAYSPTIGRMFTKTSDKTPVDVTELNADVSLVRSVCLQCHGACGFQARVIGRGTNNPQLIKLNGNPYHPSTLTPHLDWNTDVNNALKVQGQLCAKGEAGVQTLYDDKRLTNPLKRKGARGSGEWEVITWDKFYDEVIKGATLDKKDGGTYNFTGMKDLITDDLIDTNKPWLGSKRNQIVFLVGRSEHGRKEFSDRIFGKVFGTVNKRIDHTSICEQSHHIAYKAITSKSKMHPDFDNAEFVATFGGSYLEAQFPFSALSDKVMRFKERGGTFVVVDPRYSQTAKHADYWFPVKPGTDAALALAMANYIFINDEYNDVFLKSPNLTAASNLGEKSSTNATWLVNLTTHKHVTKLDVALAADGDDDAEDPVVWTGSAYAGANDVDEGVLFPGEIVVGSDTYKTSIEIYRDEATSKTVAEWLSISGLEDFEDSFYEMMAKMIKAGNKSGIDLYRGAVQHTNGYYNGISIILLNTLMGNIDHLGGMAVGGSHWHEMGTTVDDIDTTYKGVDKVGTTYSASGWKLTREGTSWGLGNEEFDSLNDPNAKPARPFYPLTSNVWQEVFGAIDSGYPYRPKIMWNHMGNPTYSVPGSAKVEEVIISTIDDGSYKLPLLISVDVVMGETSSYSDYVLPDVTFLERFATPHLSSAILTKASGIRQPIFGTFDTATGDYNYVHTPGYENAKMAEDMYIELAVKMKEENGVPLDGVGKDAFGSGEDFYNSWDWYYKLLVNFVEEYELKGASIPGSDVNQKIGYVLDRGGIYEDYSEYSESVDFQPHTLKKVLKIWSENTATKNHSFSGEKFWGTARFEEIQDMKGNKILEKDEKEGYKYNVITYKLPFHAQSRTYTNPFLAELLPENGLEINPIDAKNIDTNLKSGDKVKVSSKTSPEGMIVKVHITELVRPGVVAYAHSFGHTQYGAASWIEDGEIIEGDESRKNGFNLNSIMRLDTSYVDKDGNGAISLTDPIGGSSVYFNTLVKIEKFTE